MNATKNEAVLLPSKSGLTSRIERIAAVLLGALFMSWPALYNGFPLLYPDSMTYLDDGRIVARAVFLHQLSGYYGMRSFFYSLGILPLHWNINLWPVIAAQRLLMSYILWLVVRSVLPKHTVKSYLGLVLLLSACTSLSWYVTLVLPDILGPVLYLSIYLLIFAREALSRVERWSLYPIAWWGITSHGTHLILASGLCVLLGLWIAFQGTPRKLSFKAYGEVVVVVLLASAAQLALHAYLYGQPSLNGQRPPFLTARIIADGPGRWYLEKHCGEVKWVVCDHLANLSNDPDNVLWGSDGLWQNLSDDDAERLMREEMPFVVATLRAYPKEQISRSAANFWGQLNTFGLLDLDPSSWVMDGFDSVLPKAKSRYVHSRQAHDDLPLELFTTIQNWAVVVSLFVIAICLPHLWRRRPARLIGLSAVLVSVIVANALITGCLSMVEDRLQSRVVWMVPLLAGLMALHWISQRSERVQELPSKG